MKSFVIKLVAAIMAVVFIGSCAAGCSSPEGNVTEEKESREYCRINGKTMYFLSEEKKQELKKYLVTLLSNQKEDYIDGKEVEFDPANPHIAEGYSCGLYDVTGDGIPELLVHPRGFGGSAGNITYFVYDIMTGVKKGVLESGSSELLSVYYCSETDTLFSAVNYWTRCGWDIRKRMMDLIVYKDGAYCNEEYLYIYNQVKPVYDESDSVVSDYNYTEYYIRGEQVDFDKYCSELDGFNEKNIRIPQTDLQTISWYDIESEDPVEKANLMANALLGTTQKFIVKD